MFGGDDDFFGGLFDFDGDGKTSFGEAFIAHELFLSDEELKLEYGETDDEDTDFFEDEDEDNDDEVEEDGFYETGDESDEEDGDEYDDIDGADYADCDDDSITIPIKISFEFGGGDSENTVKRSDYPNERTYQAADFLDFAGRHPDTDYSKEIEKCRFILDNPNVTAAKYLNYQHGFLFVQAVKERFKLPVNIPDDDGEIHTMFPELFRKVSRFNVEFAVRIWHWALTMFSPYIQYGDKSDAEELTSFIMCDIDEKQLITAAVYAEAHPHFISVFLNTMSEIPCMTDEWICLCIQNNAKNTAKVLFEGCLSNKQTTCDVKERFVSSVLENACNYDETDTVKFIRDILLPIVIKYADKPMRRKMSEWQSDISEYIKENTEETNAGKPESDWREDCAYMRKTGINPDNYESESECRKAYREAQEAERQKQKERREAELNRRIAVCREIENGTEVTQYIYCAVLLPSVPRPYHYRTTDKSIKIGDKVIVPVGEDNKEMTGTVASVENHTEPTVPFPLDRTKIIIRKA